MQELLHELEKLRKNDKLILVEGKKDIIALVKFGINNVIELNKRPLEFVAERVAGETKDCVLLMDLDLEGNRLYGKLNSYLTQLGVRIDNKFRNFLYRKTKLRQIEGLIKYVKNTEFSD